jgi:hypothetical protein
MYGDCSGEQMLESNEGRWLTYEEAGELLGISTQAARMLSKRRGWALRRPNAHGDRAQVLVPSDVIVQPRSASDAKRTGSAFTSDQPHANGLDQANVRALEQAVEVLRDQLREERARGDRAERRADEAHTRADRADRRADRAEQPFAEERGRADRIAVEKDAAIAGLEVEKQGLQRQVDVALAAERGAHYRADQAERRVGELTTELDKRRRSSRLWGAIVALLTLAIAAGGLFYERHTDYFVSADYAAKNRPQLGIHDILLPQDVPDVLTATILNFGNKDAETVALEFAAVDLQTGEVTELGEANWPRLPASQSEQMSLTISGLDTNNRTKFLRTCLVYTKSGKGGDTTYGEPIYLWLSQLQRGQNYSSSNPPTRTDADRLQTDFPCPRP